MSDKPLIAGKTFVLSGQEFIFPALSVRGIKEVQQVSLEKFVQLRALMDNIEKVKGLIGDDINIDTTVVTPENIDLITKTMQMAQEVESLNQEVSCQSIFASFRRNYPHYTYDDFLDLLEPHQIEEISAWVLGGDKSAKKS